MLVDTHEEAERHGYAVTHVLKLAPEQDFLVYTLDTTQGETFSAYIKHLPSGRVYEVWAKCKANCVCCADFLLPEWNHTASYFCRMGDGWEDFVLY